MSRRRYLAGALTVVLAVAGAVLTAAPPGHAEPARRFDSGPGGAWVTLITGDRVLVRSAGGRTDVLVEPARRARPAQFQQLTRRGDRYVVPSDAATGLRAGRLDWQLFNVTGLVRQGFDDTRRASLPLLVRYTDEKAARGAGLRRVLPEVRMAALDAAKTATGTARTSPRRSRGRGRRRAAATGVSRRMRRSRWARCSTTPARGRSTRSSRACAGRRPRPAPTWST